MGRRLLVLGTALLALGLFLIVRELWGRAPVGKVEIAASDAPSVPTARRRADRRTAPPLAPVAAPRPNADHALAHVYRNP